MKWFFGNNHRQIGQDKEQQAKVWLKKHGVKTIDENYHCKGGEIDLIGLHDNTLVFIEVKFRQDSDYGHPTEFVTPKKQQHLIHCAQIYLQKHPQYQDFAMRFDVVSYSGDEKTPEWIQNAFDVL